MPEPVLESGLHYFDAWIVWYKSGGAAHFTDESEARKRLDMHTEAVRAEYVRKTGVCTAKTNGLCPWCADSGKGTDMEAVFDVPQLYRDDKPMTISMEKVGGGTVGKSYRGDWRYVVTLDDQVYASGSDLHTGTEKTHEQAAGTLADFLAHPEGASCDSDHTRQRLCLWADESDED